ncbi:hypothetical protein GCM10017673_38870 [Streptosporangium violaceochromogenes]|nr:hypothetical protein GCM10017673_38870 [Streptosporangium violaceochromogenes]
MIAPRVFDVTERRAQSDEAAAAAWPAVLQRFRSRAGRLETIPWDGDGHAFLQPRHTSLHVETLVLRGSVITSSTLIFAPVHRRGRFAVYQLDEAAFVVVCDDEGFGAPYRSDDQSLAVEVCEQWAAEFPQANGGPRGHVRA